MDPDRAFFPLQTKLFIPDVHFDLVSRPRLLAQMDQGASRKLTLVSAPAGFGKTTLVSSWLHRQDERAVWLSLDDLDNELVRLVAYMVAGFRAIDVASMTATGDLLKNRTTILVEHCVQAFVDDLLNFGHPVHLVLDDYHAIHDREIHEFLIRLTENQPANLHLIVATRSDPLLPLPKLRVTGDVVEVRSADLRFSAEEVSAYMTLAMGDAVDFERLDSDVVLEITQKTEGWIAGLRLLVLAVQSHDSDSPLMERVVGRARDFVIDYLIAEVLVYQPEDVRHFLLTSSILERFHVDLMAFLVGQETAESQATLSTIIQTNLFVVHLDHEQQWFRFHHLFQAALRQRLIAEFSPEEIRALHARASEWFAGRGLISEAVHHALAAQDLDRAMALVEANSRNYLNGIERRQLEEWLARLPAAEIWKRPALLTAKAWLLYRHWRVDELAPILDQLERIVAAEPSGLSTEQRNHVHGHVLTLRACVETLTATDADQILATSRAALAALPMAERGARATALGYRAIAQQLRGDQEPAFDLLEAALSDPSPDCPASVQLYLGLCLLCERAGDFPRMERTVRRFLAAGSNEETDHSAAHWMAGRLAYEWNQLDLAADHFSATVSCQHSTNFLAAATSMMGLARIHMIRNQWPEAQAILDHALAECNRLHNAVLQPLIGSVQAELWIVSGQPARARSWAQSIRPPVAVVGYVLTDSLLLNWTRVCLLLKESDPKNDDLLKPAYERVLCGLTAIQTVHSPYRTTQFRLLLTAFELAMGKVNAAQESLPALLPAIASGQLVRSVLDMGVGLGPLLVKFDLPESLAGELRPTSAAAAAKTAVLPQRPEVVDLTCREEEILGLMQQGRTNQEIADDLVISLYTVKRHATNIYNKMAVDNRRQAVRVAVDAGLLRALEH